MTFDKRDYRFEKVADDYDGAAEDERFSDDEKIRPSISRKYTSSTGSPSEWVVDLLFLLQNTSKENAVELLDRCTSTALARYLSRYQVETFER
jgi:hypothetical protein